MNIFDIDIEYMNDDEKMDLFSEFAQHCEESMEEYPSTVQIFGQFLSFCRMYNFFDCCLNMVSKNIPQIIQDEKNMIWNYFKKNISMDTFKEFGEKSESISTWLNTGEEMTPEAEELWKKYSDELEEPFNYNNGCLELFTFFSWIHWQIAESEAFDWSVMDDALNFISEYIFDYFEDIYHNKTGSYKCDEMDLIDAQICGSSSFKMVIKQIIGDIKTAATAGINEKEILKIEETYNNEILFNEDKCKIYANELAGMLK